MEPFEETEEEAERKVILASGDTDLRLSADGLSEIILTVSSGTELTVLAVEGDWIKVEVDGVEGWVYKGSVEGLEEEKPEEPEEKEYLPKKVTIFSSRRSVMKPGETVNLTSVLEGFEDCEEIQYQWMCDMGGGFKPVSGANSDSYSFAASQESLSWGWKLTVYYR